MAITLHPDSHTDHAIPHDVSWYVRELFADRTEFFVETVEYPESYERMAVPMQPGHGGPHPFTTDLAAVPCDLHLDVPESECRYAPRGEREYDSRLCDREPRMVRQVTIVAGPHPDDPKAGMVLFTMYGGPAAPQEPGDPRLAPEKRPESEAFWSKAALSAG
jgi:hypothetical protein